MAASVILKTFERRREDEVKLYNPSIVYQRQRKIKKKTGKWIRVQFGSEAHLPDVPLYVRKKMQFAARGVVRCHISEHVNIFFWQKM